MATAVVLAYHNVGVRCLLTLLARGVDVKLVVTHRDDPAETIWFDSVHGAAATRGIPVVFADDLDATGLHDAVARIGPDYLFSFYFRHMLPVELLALATRGAYNMHGSLLPKYRGRVPINWAIIHGETETGATLHEMAAKPDAGAIIAQTSVPILPDDTAHEVFVKVTVAAEQTLWRALPDLIHGYPFRIPNEIALGSYYGGRKADDGRIDWRRTARQVHDLVRAVAPPYPGASTTIDGRAVVVERTRTHVAAGVADGDGPRLFVADGHVRARCGDGHWLAIVTATIAGQRLDEGALAALLGDGEHRLGDSP